MEQAFLAALERRDAEVYNLLKAGHDLQLAGATVNLQALRVEEAQQGVGLAERQLDRAAIQRDTYQEWIEQHEPPASLYPELRARSKTWARQPLISIVMPRSPAGPSADTAVSKVRG